jgi:hypothetical protein
MSKNLSSSCLSEATDRPLSANKNMPLDCPPLTEPPPLAGLRILQFPLLLLTPSPLCEVPHLSSNTPVLSWNDLECPPLPTSNLNCLNATGVPPLGLPELCLSNFLAKLKDIALLPKAVWAGVGRHPTLFWTLVL